MLHMVRQVLRKGHINLIWYYPKGHCKIKVDFVEEKTQEDIIPNEININLYNDLILEKYDLVCFVSLNNWSLTTYLIWDLYVNGIC